MTQILQLANEDHTVVINLLNGIVRIRNAWEDQTPEQQGEYVYEPFGAQFAFGNYKPVGESFDILARGTASSVLAGMTRLQDFLESIRLFHAGDLAAKSCWLEWSANGEEPKRSLLYSGAFEVLSEGNLTPGIADCKILGRLVLTRHPLWENTVNSSHTMASLWSVGGKDDFTGVTGNTLARIWETTLFSSIEHAHLYRAWVGLRRYNQGTANFEPVWECENGTAGTDCGAAVADATASPEHLGAGTGRRRRVTYAAPNVVANRLTITIAQVCAAHGHTDYNHFQGRYLVLLRCKLDVAGTNGIQMRSGYAGNILSEEQFIDNTSWRLIPLGHINIPSWEGDEFKTGFQMMNFRLDIYAEQLTGGSNLDLDCLVLIPSEHLLVAEGMSLEADNTGAGQDGKAYLFVHGDDSESGYCTLEGYVSDAVDFGLTEWYHPPGNGTLVVAAEDETVQQLTDTINIRLDYYPRWLLYRGS